MNTVEVAASDAGGGATKVKRTVFLDASSLDLEIAAPAGDVAVNSGINVAVRTSATGTIGYSFNGNDGSLSVVGGIATLPLDFPAEGTFLLKVTATDPSGKVVSSARNIVFDPTPPVFTMNPASATPTTLGGRVESGASVEVFDKNGAAGTVTVTAGTWAAILTAGYDSASLLAYAVDAAGNVAVKALNPAYPDGDMNGDGAVTVADAVMALRIYAGFIKPAGSELAYYLAHGDVGPLVGGKVSPNGALDLSDALLILRKAVGQQAW